MSTNDTVKSKLAIINSNRTTLALAKILTTDANILKEQILMDNSKISLFSLGKPVNPDLEVLISSFSDLSEKEQNNVCKLLVSSGKYLVTTTEIIFDYFNDTYVLDSFKKISKTLIKRKQLFTEFLELSELPYCSFVNDEYTFVFTDNAHIAGKKYDNALNNF